MPDIEAEAIDMMATEAARIICNQKRVIHRLKTVVLVLSVSLVGACWFIVELI